MATGEHQPQCSRWDQRLATLSMTLTHLSLDPQTITPSATMREATSDWTRMFLIHSLLARPLLRASSSSEKSEQLKSHNRTEQSSEPLTRVAPHATRAVTPSWCACSVSTQLQVSVSHTRIVPSLCPE
eukprot:CAMPEP_0181331026 /NCGR_PEP_ID=MMETSP1101-20121128/24259_1 /TAXON_ID=46948 /ORGANISM="Rhodomonas abbreviata, Strain Caron Lab Isolate" /LENGTH=127 /DNA_ID=CAMNT_0023440413 /DNA_START=311 /DNA_END=694 /DNA_ORIENTATION=-